MEKESEKKIADIEVTMHVNKEKSLADAAFYKATKEIEANKVNIKIKTFWSLYSVYFIFNLTKTKGQTDTGVFDAYTLWSVGSEHQNLFWQFDSSNVFRRTVFQ